MAYKKVEKKLSYWFFLSRDRSVGNNGTNLLWDGAEKKKEQTTVIPAIKY